MRNETVIRVFNQWIAAHRAHDVDRLASLAANDITLRRSVDPETPRASGKDEARAFWQALFDTFPDAEMNVIDVISEGNALFAEVVHGGTMRGAMGDMKPTGRSYRARGAYRFDFAAGKICNIVSYWDRAEMMRQLGLPLA